FTAVERDVAGSPLATVVPRRAYTGLADGRLRWAGGRYDMSAYLGFSRISGDSVAILGQQFSSRRYYQRPDADYVEIEPGRTSLSGVTAGINHSKLAGDWLWDIDFTYESPGLELNDAGALGSADDLGLFFDIYYRRTRPGPLFHNWTAGVFQSTAWNFGRIRTGTNAGIFGDVTFKNFWSAALELAVEPRSLSDNLTRGGPLMRTPSGWRLEWDFAGRRGARNRWQVEAFTERDELDGSARGIEALVVLRPGTRWEVSVTPGYSRSVVARQYVATRAGGTAATYSGRYIFGRIERSELAAQIRLNYAITPDLTLEAYVEPFASSGRHRDFGELRAAQS
ncbi:MAG: DUF5916 domain-containing protein, partial [Gemmatimonadales bacterium]